MPTNYAVGKHFEGFIRKLVSSGPYASANDAVREGLKLLEDREKARVARLAVLQADIHEGLGSGPSEPLDMAEIKREARRQRQAMKSAAAHGA